MPMPRPPTRLFWFIMLTVITMLVGIFYGIHMLAMAVWR